MIFESAAIYRYNDEGDVEFASHPVSLIPDTKPTSIREAESRPILVRDVRLGEFALFASMADSTGVAEGAFLVTERANTEDVSLVAYSTIMQSPQSYVTSYLAKQLKSIKKSELEQFNIPELIEYVEIHFPSKKNR